MTMKTESGARLAAFVLVFAPLCGKCEGFMDDDLCYSFLPGSDTQVCVTGLKNQSVINIAIPESVVFEYRSEDENGNYITKQRTCSVTRIEENAFIGCGWVTSLAIPSSVKSIGGCAFLGCDALTNVYIDDVAAWCRMEFCDSSANPLTYANKLFVNEMLLTNLQVPNSVKNIGDYAFCGYSSLTNVAMPNSVRNIGNNAFDGCSELKNVVIGNTVTNIGNFAFLDCCSLTNLMIPNSVNRIGEWAFTGCSGLSSVTIGKSVSSIGEFAFYLCGSLTSVAIPVSVLSIGNWAFRSCEKLCLVSLPIHLESSISRDNQFRDCPQVVMSVYEQSADDRSTEMRAKAWGEWSRQGTEPYIVPESASTWDDLSRTLWLARDAYVKAGIRTEVPPTDGAIVLSLGAISVPDSMMVSEPAVETETEHGVSVWRLRVSEDVENSALVAAAGKTIFELSVFPPYLVNAWIEDVYGLPPTWLDANETETWHAARSRSRIEWFITLVPQSQWATYCANRTSDAEETRTRSGEASLTITSFRPDAATAIHNVAVRSSASGETRLWSKDSLSATNWTYSGYSLQASGTTAAGVHSVSNHMFVLATFSEIALDSDGDGIPDVMEEKVYCTNPNKTDSSGDGISDWEKVYRYGLNPRVRDTAGDGISDDEKILSGADPRVSLTAEQKAAAVKSIRYTYDDDDRLTGTFFGLGGASTKTELTPAGNPAVIHNRNATK